MSFEHDVFIFYGRRDEPWAKALEQASPAKLRGAYTQRDQQHRHGADDRTRHQETAPAESIRVARQDRREHHLCDGLRRTDQTNVDAARSAVRQVAEPELDGYADSHRADSKQATGNEQRSNRSRGRVAQLVIAGCLEHAGDLPVGHAFRVARHVTLIETCEQPLWLVQWDCLPS